MQLLQHAADGNLAGNSSSFFLFITLLFVLMMLDVALLAGVRRLAPGRTEVEDTTNGYRPLHWAARMGHAEVVSALLSCAAQHTSREKKGNTPLHLAAMYGQAEAMKVLLAARADKDSLNEVRTDEIFFFLFL
jgi:hypothetical protein